MGGVSLNLTSKSSGTLVFLHGYCEGSWIWDSIQSALKKDFNCLAVNLPGFGKRSLPEEISLRAVAREVWKELDRNSATKIILIGHSLGGYVALAMAELRPADLKGVVLFHSTPFADAEEKRENRNKVISFVEQHGTKLFLDSFAPGLFRDPGSSVARAFRKLIDTTPSDAIIYYAKAMRDRPDCSNVFKDLKTPKLVIGGRFDPIVPPAVCRRIQEITGSPQLFILENSAHAGMLEEPEKSVEILQKFAESCF